MWRGRVVRPHSRLVYYTAMHVQRLGQRRWYYLCWSIQLPQYNTIAVCVPPLVCSVVWRRALLSFLVLWKQFSLIPGEVLFLVLFFWKKTLFKSLLKQILFADDSVNRFYLNEDWICVKHETSFLVPMNSDWFAWCAGHCCGFTIIAPLQEDEEPGRWFPQITGCEVRACFVVSAEASQFPRFPKQLVFYADDRQVCGRAPYDSVVQPEKQTWQPTPSRRQLPWPECGEQWIGLD